MPSMSSRSIFYISLVAVVHFLVVALPLHAADTASQSRPNILWISCEDISPHVGSYGDKFATTPNLDQFASEGIRYTRFFGHAGVCAVNRSGIITAMYPTSIGTQHMRCAGIPPHYVKCFTEYLRAAGYFCTNRSKTDYNFTPPFTAWDRQGNRHGDWAGRATGQPFFSVINLTTTHESQIRLPDKAFFRRTNRVTAAQRHDPAKAPLPPHYPDTPASRRDYARLHDLITQLDYQVADILKKLKDDGLAENTIVFFWSDHGDGLPRSKRWIYDSGLHTPLIIRFPKKLAHLAPNGKIPGSTVDDLTAFIDLGPTVMSLANVPAPKYMQGRAFLGPHRKPARSYIYAARDRMDETYDLIRAVRDKRYKYIRNLKPWLPYAQSIEYMDRMPTLRDWRKLNQQDKLSAKQKLFMRKTKSLEELYDTRNDPWELNNLAASPDHQQILARLRTELEDWQNRTGDHGLIPEAQIWQERRPDGKFAVTAKPTLKLTRGNANRVFATLSCSTKGASIAYQLEGQSNWYLYSKPISVKLNTGIKFRACRIGFRDSQTVNTTIESTQ